MTRSLRLGQSERWIDLRNRLVARDGFQRWASRIPLLKRTAARHAGDLFGICAGFVYSQVLFACCELDLFAQLSAGPQTVPSLAAECRLGEPAMRRLLEAAAPLGLVEAVGERFVLGLNGAACLGNPAIRAMVAHHAMLYRDLADPVALLRGQAGDSRLAQFWPYAGAAAPDTLDEERTVPYSDLMSGSLALVADDVLDAYPFVDPACLLDVGGGQGDFLVAAAARRPDLRLMLFDLPPVAARARARFEREGLGERARAYGGDFKRDALPRGADIVSLVRVAHDLDEADLRSLLGRIHDALPPGGILLLAEPMAGAPGAERVGTYFSLYLLAMGCGCPRTGEVLRELLEQAGFTRVRRIPTARPMLCSLITAERRKA